MKSIRVYIDGIHCEACVKLIEQELSKISYIKKVSINLFKKEGEIFYTTEEINIEKINELIKPYGYKILLEKKDIQPKKSILSYWILPLIITFFIIIIFIVLQRSEIIKNNSLSKDNISYTLAFITGIVASFSSCFAMVGSIVIAFGEIYKLNGTKNNIKKIIIPNILFHLGRLVTFFILGGVLGVIGGTISLNGFIIGILNILISIIMLLLGLNILELVPSVVSLIKMPSIFIKNIEKIKKSTHFISPILLGFLTFFLPCGFTQSMQIFALGTGDFIKGGVLLFLFALGTLPVLFLVGITFTLSQNPKFIILKRIGAFLIILFAIYNFISGISVIGFKGDLYNIKSNGETKEYFQNKDSTSNNNYEIQKVEMRITYYGFEPQIINIKRNTKIIWEIYGDQITGCTNAIIFPYIKKGSRIKQGEKITIEFISPDKKGYLPFSCWMGMVRGAFLVE